ncbi:short-chain dehydrogenase [Aureimonas ureilytica]|uniref:Short-chain dehydrogenase n=1 Tax=Aureimonas ureilytica TaxID=401562 RepID=A0A175RVV0_9HYPH|nr:SDR family NAD(P)-dependent oxidoreductase [Aureimonas ureilytica]KTR07657.1 short-chain dehydrogenase [Aureimonas ureilytica]
MRAAPPFARAVVIGASGGVGGALALALAESGAEVEAFSRSGRAPGHPRLQAGTLDLLDEASIAAAAARVKAGGAPDLVIVATGLLHGEGVQPEKTWRQIEPDAFARLFAVNATGPALVAKHMLPLLPREGRAVFAALSARVGSISDNRLGGWVGYRASKAALNMIVQTLSLELRRTHPAALCVALHPGTVETALSDPFSRNAVRVTPEAAAGNLLRVLSTLAPEDSGGCFAWDGQRIPA